ncbi:anthranilate synthase component I family protein [Flavobacterium difficile]|uniref:Anthranilate synthase component I family protein n=1 Tax=Flavobacterium difficile TaxID=2709659 RepID=A0ABX0I8V1_9FLAO|nr:anthranilate synthase component I family protein [Flavobacterium difficile]NHM02585.1 anthranilate synthase component I family protein [Flavobacterium difficile]
MRTNISKYIHNVALFKEQLLYWSNQFREVAFLESNSESNENQLYKSYDLIVAVEAFTSIQTDSEKAFEDLYQYQSKANDWLFGYLSYDLKNDIEHLKSENFDGLHFPDLFFFQPKKIFFLKENTLEIQYLNMCDDEVETDLEEITRSQMSDVKCQKLPLTIKQRISKENYLQKTQKMLAHIHRGDIYEANFCMEFFAENAIIEPLEIYQKLNQISASPFATYFKKNQHYLLSASPERYLKKEAQKVISQPIKGTAKRSLDAVIDHQNINELQNDPKERSENIMIVDLVRNDLSQTATKGSVEVEELCKIYSFKQVHQMISTIVSNVEHTTSPIEILRTTFPMGSMTGAPKISAMQIIEEVEETKRGLYSGAVGYFTPTGNFDFNVVIRSILYNSENQYLSFSVGSAITSEAIPEKEYEECLLKANAMFEVLQVK